MVNIDRIRGCMAEKGDKQKDLARILNLSLTSVNIKLTGKTDFTVSEISKIAERYKKSISFFISK